MNVVALLFSTKGRLAGKPFAWAVLAVYLAGFASLALLAPGVATRSGLMLKPGFAAVAAILKFLLLLACLPALIAPSFSLWAATCPSAAS